MDNINQLSPRHTFSLVKRVVEGDSSVAIGLSREQLLDMVLCACGFLHSLFDHDDYARKIFYTDKPLPEQF